MLICVTTDVYFGYQKPPRLRLSMLCIHKRFHFGQALFREFTNEIERDKDAFETNTIYLQQVKWKSHSTLMSKINHQSYDNESSSSVKPQEPNSSHATVVPDFPAQSGCFHSCRLCVPNHPPLPEYDSKLMRPSALNVQLGDITDRCIQIFLNNSYRYDRAVG